MNTNEPLRAWEALQPTQLLRDLAQLFERWQWIVAVVVFLVVVGGHGMRIYEARNTSRALMHEWYMTTVVLIFALLSPWMVRTAAASIDDWQRELATPSPNDVARKLVSLAFTFPDLDALISTETTGSPESSDEALREEGLYGYASGFWSDLESDMATAEDTSDADRSVAIATGSAVSLKAWAVLGGYVATTSSLLVSAVVIWAMDLIRALALTSAVLAMPMAIACFRVGSFKGIAHGAIHRLISILCWPVAWIVGHLLTKSIFNAFVGVYCGTDEGRMASRLGWDQIDAVDAGEWAGLANDLGMAVPYSWLLLCSLAAAALLVWILGVAVGGPVILHRAMRWVPAPFGRPDRESRGVGAESP